MGTRHRPRSVRPYEPALGTAGVAGWRPQGGCPSFGRAAQLCCPCLPRAGGVGVGTQHRLHTVRSCELALRAVGVAVGRFRGSASRHCEGRLGIGARPSPAAGASRCCEGRLESGTNPPSRCPSLGRVARVSWLLALVAGLCVWGPGTVPLACVPCGGVLCAMGVAGGCPGMDLFTVLGGRLVSSAPPPRAARLWSGRPGPIDRVFGHGW